MATPTPVTWLPGGLRVGKTGSTQQIEKFVFATLSPVSVAANTTAEQLVTVTPILTTDRIVAVSKPTAQAGLALVGWRIAAANSVGLTFLNDTASPIVPTASESYAFNVVSI